MSFWRGSNCTLFFTDQGAGIPVVFIHGWMCDSHDWSWQLAAFAGAYRTIAVDSPGHGRSSPSTRGYHPDAIGSDIRELLVHLGVSRFVAVGHSLGAVIAVRLADRHPSDVIAVVTVDPAYGVTPSEAQTVNILRSTLRASRSVTSVAGFFDKLEGPHTSDGLRTWHCRRALGVDIEVAIASIAAIFEATDQISLATQSETFLRRLQCPLLAVHRDPVRGVWEEMTFHHPLSKSVVFRDVGHWIHQEVIADFNQVTLTWMEEIIERD